MLGLIAALAVLSALVLVGVVFRPTQLQVSRRSDAIGARTTQGFAVLGAFPARESERDYAQLVGLAGQRGVTIDWDRARQELAASDDPRSTLMTVAGRQL